MAERYGRQDVTYDDSTSEAGGRIEVADRRGVPRNLVVLIVVDALDNIDFTGLRDVSTVQRHAPS